MSADGRERVRPVELLGPPLPAYQDAMCAGCAIPMADLRLTPPPPYETVCQSADPILTYEVSSTHEDRAVGGSARRPDVETQNVLEALDKEFRWTAVLFGVSVSVLIVTILLIVIIFVPRDRQQIND